MLAGLPKALRQRVLAGVAGGPGPGAGTAPPPRPAPVALRPPKAVVELLGRGRHHHDRRVGLRRAQWGWGGEAGTKAQHSTAQHSAAQRSAAQSTAR